jgi:hypothetical protein
MNPHDKFIADRNRIVDALKFSDIPTIQFNKDNIPKILPCAILILDSEAGKHGHFQAVCGYRYRLDGLLDRQCPERI